MYEVVVIFNSCLDVQYIQDFAYFYITLFCIIKTCIFRKCLVGSVNSYFRLPSFPVESNILLKQSVMNKCALMHSTYDMINLSRLFLNCY